MDLQFRPKFVETKEREQTPSPQERLSPGEAHSLRVERALEQHVERAELGLAPAWSKKASQVTTQADLDMVRGMQAMRVDSVLTRKAAETMVEMDDWGERLMAAHPQIAARVQGMLNREFDGLMLVPGMITNAFLRRDYKNGADCEVETKTIN